MPLKARLSLASSLLLFTSLSFASGYSSSSSSKGSRGQEVYKLHWELPCTFTYPDGDTYPYHQAYCDYILAHEPKGQRFFEVLPLYNSDPDSKEANRNQIGFLKKYAAEAQKALDEFTRQQSALLQKTDPALTESQDKPMDKTNRLVQFRKTVVEECPKIAEPFGGKDLYLKECNQRLDALDKSIEASKEKLTTAQKESVEKMNKRVFLGHGSAAGASAMSKDLGGKGSSADAGNLDKFFNKQNSGGDLKAQGQLDKASLGAISPGGTAPGAFAGPAWKATNAEMVVPQVGGTKVKYELSKNVPTMPDGSPRLKPGDTFSIYEPEGITHASELVVLKDGRVARRDSAPDVKGPIIIYPDFDSAVNAHHAAGEVPQVTYAGSNGKETLEYMRSGQSGSAAGSVVTRVVAKIPGLGFMNKAANYMDWCASDAEAAVAAQTTNPFKKVAYSLAGTHPWLLKEANELLVSKPEV
jgi:hypothetical protein